MARDLSIVMAGGRISVAMHGLFSGARRGAERWTGFAIRNFVQPTAAPLALKIVGREPGAVQVVDPLTLRDVKVRIRISVTTMRIVRGKYIIFKTRIAQRKVDGIGRDRRPNTSGREDCDAN